MKKLNKTSSYVLLNLLSGDATTSEVAKHIPGSDIRSVQRALERLKQLGLVRRGGPRNNPSYVVRYPSLLTTEIADKLLEDEDRPSSKFNHQLIGWLGKAPLGELGGLFGGPDTVKKIMRMTAKDLEYLTVELSWKSSALEGNTYTLLDTQLLLVEGLKAKGHTEFETQMILNHKNTIGFIIEHPDLFRGAITFATLEELHNIIGDNLGIAKGIRRRSVKVSASNYAPLANPHQLRENADKILGIINRPADPFARSLFALSLVPYLQLFEDGNKRTGRMLANAILIASVGKGFSLRRVSPRQLALAYLAFYEFNSMAALSDILRAELTQGL